MNKVLVISGHPDLRNSVANRTILAQIFHEKEVRFTDLESSYPRHVFDIALEQQKLKEADLIVLQFPFIWYGVPGVMKLWLEEVMSMGFAFGPGGNALEGKKLLLSITLGGDQASYSSFGQHGYPIETFLRPLEKFVKYCKMEYLEPLYSYAMAVSRDQSEEKVYEKALVHATKLRVIIEHTIHQSIEEDAFRRAV